MAEYDRLMNLNVRSVVQLTNLACPYLAEAKGTIVNVSSIAGLNSFEGVGIYCMSKAALDMFTRCSALDLAKNGIRVNSVNPALIVTEFQRRMGISEEDYQAFVDRSIATYPLGKIGQPKDVADAIMYQASDSAGFVTGVLLPISGGKHTHFSR